MESEGRALVVAAEPELAVDSDGFLVVGVRDRLHGAAETFDGGDRGLEIVDPEEDVWCGSFVTYGVAPSSPPWTPAGTPTPRMR